MNDVWSSHDHAKTGGGLSVNYTQVGISFGKIFWVTAIILEMPISSWDERPSPELQRQTTEALEEGHVLYFPELAFPVSAAEREAFSTSWSDGQTEKVAVEINNSRLKGATAPSTITDSLESILWRYAEQTQHLLYQLFPHYQPDLRRARTSFRPVEIVEGAPASVAEDNTRLHVDAFHSHPTQGDRILGVFTNVNPEGREWEWRIGEPFPDYARRFLPCIRRPWPGEDFLLQRLGIIHGRRSLYDQYMLRLRDAGKADVDYQTRSPQETFDFPAGSTWLCFTDQVLHADLRGQYLLEQTFHLPVAAQLWEENAPLRCLEGLLNQRLASSVP